MEAVVVVVMVAVVLVAVVVEVAVAERVAVVAGVAVAVVVGVVVVGVVVAVVVVVVVDPDKPLRRRELIMKLQRYLTVDATLINLWYLLYYSLTVTRDIGDPGS